MSMMLRKLKRKDLMELMLKVRLKLKQPKPLVELLLNIKQSKK